MKIGKPIEFMLVSESGTNDSKFADVIKRHSGKTRVETKYDGYRTQIHKDGKIYLFSKSLIELDSGLFPDIVAQTKAYPNGSIFDCEMVGFGDSHLEAFRAVQNRMGKNLTAEGLKNYPLQARVFDVLQWKGQPLLDVPLAQRRKILEDNLENISDQEEIVSGDRLKARFQEAVDQNLEGVVCKNPDSDYLPGSKGKDWIKLKKFLTLDFAVLGIYFGQGKAAELPFAALLLGTENEGRYETISKVGISNRKMIAELYDRIKGGLTKTPPRNVILSKELGKKTYAGKIPDMYVTPERSGVVEVETLNITRSENWHTCGLENGFAYSLRIASVKRIRGDKRICDINTTKQVAEIYS